MSLPIWPWAIHGTKVRARRRPATISLDLESLEDRLVPSTTLTHDQWRQATFHVDDVSVANLPVTGIGRRGALGIQAQADSAASLIHLDQVFADYAYRGDGYSVAVIDTGIDYTHPDLGGGWGKRVVAGYDFVNHDSDPMDDNGHGTHVAGTVGGAEYGVAKGVSLVAVRVLDCNGSGTTSGVVTGVNWVAANAIKPAVANMSLGGGPDTTLDTAVRNAITSGVTFGIASGNSNANACNYSPARVAEAITVNASDISDNRASFSNYGTCTDIFAPGVNITSSWNTSDTATNTISGTSMATPHVVGAAALYLATNPAATPAQVQSAMVAAATPNKIVNP